MASKINRLLLLTLTLTLGFGQLLRFEYHGIPLYLHDILIATILLLNYKIIISQLPRYLFWIKIFASGLAVGWIIAITIYPSSTLLVPLLYSVRVLAYLTLYFVLNTVKTKIPIQAFLLSTLVMLTIGYLQYFVMPDMRWAKYLGWDDHLYRLTMPYYDPNYAGVMLSLALLSLCHLYPWLSFLIFPAILLTMSRSTWVVLAMVGISYGIKTRRYVLLGLTSLVFVAYIIYRPIHFGEGNNLLRTYSITSRMYSDLAYISARKSSVLTGQGMNTLMLNSPASLTPNHATGPNNSYLYLLLTTGVIGLIGWGRIMLGIYNKSDQKPMLSFFFLASLFNNVMFYPFALLWVLLIANSMAPT